MPNIDIIAHFGSHGCSGDNATNTEFCYILSTKIDNSVRFPPLFCRLPGNFRSLALAEGGRSRFAALPAKRHGSRVLTLRFGGRDVVLGLPYRDPHNMDCVADHVGRAFLPFWSSGHLCSLMLSGKLGKELADA